MDWLNVFQTVGFPVAMCLLTAYYVKYTGDNHREEMTAQRQEFLTSLSESTAKHESEIKNFSDALNNNTAIITKLYERMVQDEK